MLIHPDDPEADCCTCPKESDRRWTGWAVDRPGQPLYVLYGGNEHDVWQIALGWPSDEEIVLAKALGARAFQVEIRPLIS